MSPTPPMPPEDTQDGRDPVAVMLRDAARPVDRDRLVDLSADLAGQVAAVAVPRRSLRRMVAIGLAAAVVLVPTTAAAYSWTTHTGLFGDPEHNTEDVDRSEVLDVCAPDFLATARGLLPKDLVLAPGVTAEQVLDRAVANLTRQCTATTGVVTQATGVPAQAEAVAWCGWIDAYLADPTLADRAAAAFRHYADSPVTATVDGDGGYTRAKREVAAATARHDTGPARRDQQLNCTGAATSGPVAP